MAGFCLWGTGVYERFMPVIFTVFSIVKFFLGKGDELKNLPPDLRKRVKRLRQDGDLVGAAELLFQEEEYVLAAALFSEAKMPARAAEAQEYAGNAAQAIALYKTVGNRRKAGELYAEMGQYDAAAQQMLATGDQRSAALFFSRGGQHRRAGELYEMHGEFVKAAKCFADAGDTAQQMEMYVQAFDAEYRIAQGNLKIIESARQMAREAATWIANHGEAERAVKLMLKAGFLDEAGKLYAKAGQYGEAARLMEEAGQFANAAKMYQDAGDPKKAAGARAQAALSAGNMEDAARMLVNAGEWGRAAEILLDLNQPAKAARLYAKGGLWNKAAALFEKDGDIKSAARAYEQGKEYGAAADLFKKIDDPRSEIRVCEAMEDYYRVGRILVSIDRLNEAVEALQRVSGNDPRYQEALELRGDILWKARRHGAAYQAYMAAFGDANPNASNIQLLYKMGRCMESEGNSDVAVRAFEQVASVDSNYRDVSARAVRLKQNPSAPRQSGVHAAVPSPAPRASAGRRSGVLKRPSSGRLKPAARATTPRSGEVSVVPSTSSMGRRARKQRSQPQMQPSAEAHPFELANQGGAQARYEVIEEIARGGMGVVFMARDVVLSRIVAYKILSKQLRDNEFAREYFLREARAAAKLQHTNIVSVYDAGVQDGEYFMAMEFIDGKTLKQVVTRQGPFPEKLVHYVAQYSCRGLQYAHDRGLVHRDIKSGNIMLTNEGKTVKIMDFGLAKVVKESQQDHTRAIGTPFYMSPEQILGADLDQRSDIYSLGVTLFEIATGTVPFFKGDLAYHHVHTEPPSPRSLNPSMSVGLEDIILKAMAKSPDERFTQCNDLIAALKSIRR